jgi:hypothetical protein
MRVVDAPRMRSLPCLLVTELLALLLVVTSPTGTGQGVHHDQLLDLLFPHVHMVDGRVVASDQVAPSLERSVGSPVLGAAAGASATAVGTSVMPPTPIGVQLPPIPLTVRRAPSNDPLPTGLLEAPPDPPPTSSTA